jgi:putative phosphoribosyl transferase
MIFRDRTQAAEMLGKKLQRFKEKWGNSLIVLAIPRGGVVTGQVIADALDVSLDLVVAKKLGDP